MSAPESNRRDFLKGRAAALALGAKVEQFADSLPMPEPTGQSLLVKYGRKAMACEFEVILNARQDEEGAAAALAALDQIEQLEAQLSVYRDASEVSQFNQAPSNEPVPIEAEMLSLMEMAQQISTDTEGAFDISSGPLSEVWGFFRREGRMPRPDALATALARVGFQHLQVNRAAGMATRGMPDLQINFNSIGKGYALDRAAQVVQSLGIQDALLQGGQSSILGIGGRGGDAQLGWPIGIAHPLRPGQRLGIFKLRNKGLSTSNSQGQFFIHRGQRYGHLIDPRSGHPAQGVHSVTVIAPSAALAEGFSTAFYVLGLCETARNCAKKNGLQAMFVLPEGSGSSIRWETVGVEPDDWLEPPDSPCRGESGRI